MKKIKACHLSFFWFLFEACPEPPRPPRIGYEYEISPTCEEDFPDYIRLSTTYCEKFANDHPNYSWFGTVSRSAYPKGCYLSVSDNQVIFNAHVIGGESNSVTLIENLLCHFVIARVSRFIKNFFKLAFTHD